MNFFSYVLTRESSNNFYKITKSSNCPLETGQRSNHYLLRRYVANGEDVTRNSHGERHIDFSITTFGFCDQTQKISPSPCEANKVSGLSNEYRENDFRSFREKIKACVSTMSGDFHATKNFSLKSHKNNCPDVIDCPGHFACTNSVSIGSTGANISSTEKGVLQWYVTLGNLAREELRRWMENLKLCNGRKIQQREPHMIIQTDASTKGWRAYCKGVSTAEK